MKNQRLQNLLAKLSQESASSTEQDLTILSNATSLSVKGGAVASESLDDPCGTKCKPNTACNNDTAGS